MSQIRNTILAALRFYQDAGQGDPANRSDAIHAIATDNDQDISLDAEGIEGLIKSIQKPCAHKKARSIGESAEGMGSIDVKWCPDCGATKRTMTNWKYTDYPWKLPKKTIQPSVES